MDLATEKLVHAVALIADAAVVDDDDRRHVLLGEIAIHVEVDVDRRTGFPRRRILARFY
jgi:hypothetical protein